MTDRKMEGKRHRIRIAYFLRNIRGPDRCLARKLTCVEGKLASIERVNTDLEKLNAAPIQSLSEGPKYTVIERASGQALDQIASHALDRIPTLQHLECKGANGRTVEIQMD